MIDTDTIRRGVDLVALIGRDTNLVKVSRSSGGELAGPCPMCKGVDRFHVQPERGRWLCRNCTDGRWRDAIDYVRLFYGIDFKAACEKLGAGELVPIATTPRPAAPAPVDPVDREKWAAAGLSLVAAAEAALWSPDGAEALRYLHESRGLTDETIKAFRLGYIHATCYDSRPSWGLQPEVNEKNGKPRMVWLPRGIVIPSFADGRIQYIKIRRHDYLPKSKDDPKIVFVKGGHPALFNADALVRSDIVLLAEGELDAILAHQAAAGILAAGTLGSASAHLDIGRFSKYLLHARRILVVGDRDAAGKKLSEHLAQMSDCVEGVGVPELRSGDKDITDYWRSGGDVGAWLRRRVAPAEPPPTPAVEPVAAAPIVASAPTPAELPELEPCATPCRCGPQRVLCVACQDSHRHVAGCAACQANPRTGCAAGDELRREYWTIREEL